jgi:hypothetical protein
LVLNKTVDVKSYGADRNGRTLGEVFLLDGKNINIEMIQVGLAEVYRGKPASGLDMDAYWKAEEDAQIAKRGVWVLGDKYMSPREWRKAHQKLSEGIWWYHGAMLELQHCPAGNVFMKRVRGRLFNWCSFPYSLWFETKQDIHGNKWDVLPEPTSLLLSGTSILIVGAHFRRRFYRG